MSKALYRQIIMDARDLIAAEHRWIQKARAITRGRDRIEPHHPRAKRFCAMGALERTAFNLTGDVVRANHLPAQRANACVLPPKTPSSNSSTSTTDRGTRAS